MPSSYASRAVAPARSRGYTSSSTQAATRRSRSVSPRRLHHNVESSQSSVHGHTASQQSIVHDETACVAAGGGAHSSCSHGVEAQAHVSALLQQLAGFMRAAATHLDDSLDVSEYVSGIMSSAAALKSSVHAMAEHLAVAQTAARRPAWHQTMHEVHATQQAWTAMAGAVRGAAASETVAAQRQLREAQAKAAMLQDDLQRERQHRAAVQAKLATTRTALAQAKKTAKAAAAQAAGSDVVRDMAQLKADLRESQQALADAVASRDAAQAQLAATKQHLQSARATVAARQRVAASALSSTRARSVERHQPVQTPQQSRTQPRRSRSAPRLRAAPTSRTDFAPRPRMAPQSPGDVPRMSTVDTFLQLISPARQHSSSSLAETKHSDELPPSPQHNLNAGAIIQFIGAQKRLLAASLLAGALNRARLRRARAKLAWQRWKHSVGSENSSEFADMLNTVSDTLAAGLHDPWSSHASTPTHGAARQRHIMLGAGSRNVQVRPVVSLKPLRR